MALKLHSLQTGVVLQPNAKSILAVLAQLKKQNVTGKLRFTPPPGNSEWEINFLFHKGELLFASSTQPGERLGEFLVRRGVLSSEQVQQALTNAHQDGRLFHAYLVENGLLEINKLQDLLYQRTEDLLHGILSHQDGQEGHFSFQPSAPKFDFTAPRVDQDLYARLIKRRKQWPRIYDLFVNQNMILQRRPGIENSETYQNLNPVEQKLLRLLDGVTPVRELLSRHRNRLDLMIQVARFLKTGLAEAVAIASESSPEKPQSIPIAESTPSAPAAEAGAGSSFADFLAMASRDQDDSVDLEELENEFSQLFDGLGGEENGFDLDLEDRPEDSGARDLPQDLQQALAEQFFADSTEPVETELSSLFDNLQPSQEAIEEESSPPEPVVSDANDELVSPQSDSFHEEAEKIPAAESSDIALHGASAPPRPKIEYYEEDSSLFDATELVAEMLEEDFAASLQDQLHSQRDEEPTGALSSADETPTSIPEDSSTTTLSTWEESEDENYEVAVEAIDKLLDETSSESDDEILQEAYFEGDDDEAADDDVVSDEADAVAEQAADDDVVPVAEAQEAPPDEAATAPIFGRGNSRFERRVVGGRSPRSGRTAPG